jgi:cytochrome c oxidase subunit III
VRERVVANLSALPQHSGGTASPSWWGTIGFMLIEGTGFALVIAVYFYLMSLAPRWPPNAPPPNLGPGILLTFTLLLSLVPNILLSLWAKNRDLLKIRAGLIVMSVFGALPLVIRAFEFPALNVMWDANAYGSVVWVLLGLHTTHLITDLVETLVLTALMFSSHADNGRRYGDVEDNAMYWNFVVVAWLPVYATIYWAPRL